MIVTERLSAVVDCIRVSGCWFFDSTQKDVGAM